MNRAIKYLLLIAILLTEGVELHSQLQPLLDQHHLNGLAINPAYAGSQEALNVGIHSRAQWIGFEGAPRTTTFSAHAPLRDKKTNLGILVMGDRLGSLRETGFMLNYSYRMELGSGKLAMGLGAGLTHLSTRIDALRFANPGDQLLQDPARRALLPEFSVGAYYHTDTYFAGISMPLFMSHLTQDNGGGYHVAFRPGEANYLVNGGYLFRLSNSLELLPSILARYNPASAFQLDFHCNLILLERFWIGGGIRTNGNLSALLQIQVNPQFRIGYSYGYELSELSSFQHGSHEVVLRYNFRYLLNVISPRYF